MKSESLLVLDKVIEYSVKESTLAKRMRVAVYADGDVVATKPIKTSFDILRIFIESKKHWIVKKLEEKKIQVVPELKENSRIHYLKHKIEARNLVNMKLEKWNKDLEYEYKNIKVKQLKSRWGSCSANRELSFNYKILFLPEIIQDYIVIHELCHLKEMNHSKKFWVLVGSSLPNYLSIKEKIKRI
jgi:predicted metal-dependent hydrolase